MNYMSPGDSIEVFGFLSMTYLINTGMAFSMLAGRNSLLIPINLLIIGFIIYILVNSYTSGLMEDIAYYLIVAGACSNLWDRFFYAGVIDFIDLGFWPVFNIADAAISTGAAMLLLSIFIQNKEDKKKSDVS